MRSFTPTALKLVLALCISFSLSACNGGSTSSQFLKNVSLQVTQQGTDAFLKLTSSFDLGNVSLAEMSIQIIDPRTQVERGAVNFSQLPNGQGQITVEANASLMANADVALGQILPNGKPLPLVLGAPTGEMLGVKILDHSTVYLGGNTNTAAYAGVALGIKGFDQVMNQLQTPANIFFMGNFSNSVLGVGGIYGSNNPGESGIAIFGKYTKTAAKNGQLSADEVAADFEIQKLNRATLYRLHKFFHGKKRMLEIY
jgi:hypothetical protein